jgi:hypothetical protein
MNIEENSYKRRQIMFTSVDKAIVGLVMGILFLLNNFTSYHVGFSEEVVNGFVGFLTPILVYFWPNKA